MMDDTLFFSTKSIGTSTRQGRKPQSLLDAIRHNRRQIYAEVGPFGRIDPARSHLNENLAGPVSPDGVVALAQSLMSAIGYVPDRHDFTQAFELVFSLPVGSTVNTTLFFNSCMAWTTEKFGADVILSADIHNDEATAHMHVLVSPIAGGRYLGTKLITKMELDALRKSFAEMALGYGLREPVRKLYGTQRDDVARLVICQLQANHDPILQSVLWPMVQRDIKSKPGKYAANLGIAIPEAPVKEKRVKTLAELAVSPGKGPKRDRESRAIGFKESWAEGQCKPIGFESTKPSSALKAIGLSRDGEMAIGKKSNQSCVLVSPKTPTVSTCHGTYRRMTANPIGLFTRHPGLSRSTEPQRPAFLPQPNLADVSPHGPNVIHPAWPATPPSSGADLSHLTTVRVRDTDLTAGTWDESLGEFVRSPPATGANTTQHVISTKAKTSVAAMVPGDSYVERDEIYQPYFSDNEESPAWQD